MAKMWSNLYLWDGLRDSGWKCSSEKVGTEHFKFANHINLPQLAHYYSSNTVQLVRFKPRLSVSSLPNIRTSFVRSDKLRRPDVPALSADMQPNSSCSSVQWWSMKETAQAAAPGGLVDGEHCQLLLLSYVAPDNVHEIKYWLSESL